MTIWHPHFNVFGWHLWVDIFGLTLHWGKEVCAWLAGQKIPACFSNWVGHCPGLYKLVVYIYTMFQYIVTVYFKYNIAEHIVTCVLETLHSTPTDFPSKQKSKHAVYVREYKSIRYSMYKKLVQSEIVVCQWHVSSSHTVAGQGPSHFTIFT